jgi:hypothetical protein
MNRLFAVAITVGLALQAQAAFSFSGSVGDEVLPIEPVGPVSSFLQCPVKDGVINYKSCQSVLECSEGSFQFVSGTKLPKGEGLVCIETTSGNQDPVEQDYSYTCKDKQGSSITFTVPDVGGNPNNWSDDEFRKVDKSGRLHCDEDGIEL